MPDNAGGLVETEVKFPVWFDPEASGGTPMCAALRMAGDLLADWCREHPHSFPPTVMHVTDGEATDGSEADVEAAAAHVTESGATAKRQRRYCLTCTSRVRAVSPFVSQQANSRCPAPITRKGTLFRTSSLLPAELQRRATEAGVSVRPDSRGYVYNGRMDDVVTFFDIGTRPRLAGGDR